MNNENIGYYILQYITIAITLTLGVINFYLSKKLQRGQNIISVTTNNRIKRYEQLKGSAQKLISNTSVELLLMNENNYNLIYNAVEASDTISLIMHRAFEKDRELIELASDISNLAVKLNSDLSNKKLQLELKYKQDIFTIKCDIYTTADWNRIKTETEGENTSAEDWVKYYERIESSFFDEINEITSVYEKTISQL